MYMAKALNLANCFVTHLRQVQQFLGECMWC